MAENFFTGLTGAIQQNAKQRNNDDYIDLMRERQLSSEMQNAVSNKRADEEMGMRREEAVRRNRALDFDFNQKEEQARRVNDYRAESSQFAKNFWTPTPVLNADGTPVLDETGAPKMNRRDPNNYRDQFNFYSGIADIAHKYNGVDPVTYGKFLIDKKNLEDQGRTQVFEKSLQRDPGALAEVGAAVGLTGGVNVVSKKDKYGLPMFVFIGKDKDGKSAEVDALTAMSLFGAPNAKNPAAAERAQTKEGIEIGFRDRQVSAQEKSAAASMVGALNRGRRGGGDDGDEDGPLTGKAFRTEAERIQDNYGGKVTFSNSFGQTSFDDKPMKDQFAEEKRTSMALDFLRNGIARPDGSRAYFGSGSEAMRAANTLFEKAEETALSGISFKLEKGRGWSVVSKGTPGSVGFSNPGVPLDTKIRARNAAYASIEESAKAPKRQSAIEK
jgi:hypothetical protein